jgi:hypothetical protein
MAEGRTVFRMTTNCASCCPADNHQLWTSCIRCEGKPLRIRRGGIAGRTGIANPRIDALLQSGLSFAG